MEQLASLLQPSQNTYTLTLLHDLWERRDDLGFVLLDASALAELAAALPEHETAQTPYIPPRIWLYQVTRLRALLDDFNAHSQQIEDCFMFCHSMGTARDATETDPARRSTADLN